MMDGWTPATDGVPTGGENDRGSCDAGSDNHDRAAARQVASSRKLQQGRKQRRFIELAAEIGFVEAARLLSAKAPPDARAKIATAISVAEFAPYPVLSQSELKKFKHFAKSNPWVPYSGISPSQHIKEKFKPWLGRGLWREDIHDAQPNLEISYATEIRENPKRRIKKLLQRPYRLPSGTYRSPSLRVVADLTESEKLERRSSDAERQRRSRANRRAKQSREPNRPSRKKTVDVARKNNI